MLFSIILTLNIASAESHVMNVDNYIKKGYWENTPSVVICKNQTIFSLEDVEYVMKKWGNILSVQVKEKCNYEIETGKIKIIDDKMIDRKKYNGLTEYYFYTKKTDTGITYKEYTGAIVQLNKEITNIEILLHEIGHAYGYAHYDHGHDVMNTYKYY